ncbi:hypothetical protein IDE33_002630 [Enterococcus faecalis]|nr:hypothetical protein [Enterococcus faecalis]
MLKEKYNENKLKRIWQIVAFENQYDSYNSYIRDRKRYVVYTVIMLVLFILGVYFTVEFLSVYCFVGLILLLYTNFLSLDCYREFAPKVWKVRGTIKLKEEYPVILDRKSNNVLFYEKKEYGQGVILEKTDSVKAGFVVSRLSLKNVVFFDNSEEKVDCIAVEKLEYEDERFEEKFSKGVAAGKPRLGDPLFHFRYIVYTNNLKEVFGGL